MLTGNLPIEYSLVLAEASRVIADRLAPFGICTSSVLVYQRLFTDTFAVLDYLASGTSVLAAIKLAGARLLIERGTLDTAYDFAMSRIDSRLATPGAAGICDKDAWISYVLLSSRGPRGNQSTSD